MATTKPKVPKIRVDATRASDVLRQCEADGYAARLRGKAWAANPYETTGAPETPEVVRRVVREMSRAWLQGWERANLKNAPSRGQAGDALYSVPGLAEG